MAMVPLEEMFTSPGMRAQIELLLQAPRGIFAFNGTTGSGKSTSLFSVGEELRRRGRNLVLLMTEREMVDYLKANSDFADWDVQMLDGSTEAWQRALPDAAARGIVIAGNLEPRNARVLVEAATNGAVIFTQIDTPYVGIDVGYALDRMQVTADEFLRSFSCVVTQVLLKRLCKQCGTQVTLPVTEARYIDPSATESLRVWQEVGCTVCEGRGTRYRHPVHEVMVIDDASRPLLAAYLEQGYLRNPLPASHIPMQACARELLQIGEIGVNTYRREITQNPILRMQHQWELERNNAGRIRDMFSRFVTSQVVDRILADAHVQAIVEGERRWVTVMFADIRGYTTLAEGMGPTELFGLLNLYFKQIIHIVQEHGGTIDKFVGDCVMVLFGAPVDAGDQEWRAVRCAVEIQRVIAELNASRPGQATLQMGIGINTGEAMTGCLGSAERMDYTALGDTVNTAARLESRAQGGQVLVGPATAEAVRGRIDCVSVGPLQLKGKTEAIEAFEVR